MNKVITTVIATGALALVTTTAQAQDWGLFGNYTDVVPYQNYVGGVPTLNPGVNTWNAPSGTIAPFRISSWDSDGAAAADPATTSYRLRTGGGGGSSDAYNGDLYYTSQAYDGLPNVGGPSYTRVTGLSANTTYTIAMYGIVGGNKDQLSYSLNGGTTWSSPIDEAVINLKIGADWLVESTTDAIGTPIATRSGDTRFRIIIGDLTTDGSGNLVVGFRHPDISSTGAGSDRGRIDGFAFAEGSVLVVPEPTTFALAGLGAAALLIFRRRS